MDERSPMKDPATALPETASPPAPASPASPERRPFKPLSPYGAEDVDRFLGRDVELAELGTELARPRVLLVHGEAGAGKTSLVRCGLEGRLREAGSLVVTLRPGTDPMAALTAALVQHQETSLTLIIDPAEEILLAEPGQDIAALGRELARWLDGSQDLRVLLCVREEHLERLTPLAEHLTGLFGHRLWVRPLSFSQAREAVLGAAAACQVPIEEALVLRVISQLTRSHGGVDCSLLHVVLDRLHREAQDRQVTSDPEAAAPGLGLTLALFEELGQTWSILDLFLEAQVEEQGDPDTLRALLKTLVDLDGRNQARTREEILEKALLFGAEISAPHLDTVLEQLKDHRIVLEEAGSGRVELRHPAFAPTVRSWFTRDEEEVVRLHDALVSRHQEYLARGRSDHALPDGAFLQELASHRSRLHLSQTLTALLDDSELVQAHRARRRRSLAPMLALALGVLSLVLLFAWQLALRRAAEVTQERARIQRDAEAGTNRTIMAAFHRLRAAGKPMEAYALLRVAARPQAGRDGERQATKEGLHLHSTDPMALVLAGHGDAVRQVAYSPDGQRMATASWDKTAKIWDVQTGRPLLSLVGHQHLVHAVTFSPDGRQLASASSDKRVQVWDAQSGRALHYLAGHDDVVSAVAYSSDGTRMATASDDRTARIWDAQTGRQVLSLTGHTDAVFAVAFSPDGQRLVTASRDKTARIWDSRSGALLRILEGHTHWVNAVAFSPDGRLLATAASDKIVRIWDAPSGRLLRSLSGHGQPVWTVAFSPDGQRLATGASDAAVLIWDAHSGRLMGSLPGHQEPVWSVVFSPDGRQLATGASDGYVRIWDTELGRLVGSILRQPASVPCVTYSPDGARLATGSADATARIWDAHTGGVLLSLAGHGHWVDSLAFSPDGAHLASGSADRTARIWDAQSGALLRTLTGHAHYVTAVAYSPDGQRVATASWDKTARIWDAQSGQLLHSLTGHQGEVFTLAFSPDGRRLATGSWDMTARIWDTQSGRTLRTLKGHRGSILSLAYSPDGRRIATASEDRTARIWNALTGRPSDIVVTHDWKILSVAFSPDGQRIATTSEDQSARIWDAYSGRLLRSLMGHDYAVSSAAFSPDGHWLATASEDQTVRIWDAKVRSLPTLLAWTGARTNLRVCRDSFAVLPVLPFPPPETLWAPEKLCQRHEAIIRGDRDPESTRLAP